MALRWRIKAIPEKVPQDGGPDITLWHSNEILIQTEVYDDTAPAVVILPKNYVLSGSWSNQQMIDHITNDLSRLKAAQARWAGLQSSIGAAFAIP